jgi:hypothetical protein
MAAVGFAHRSFGDILGTIKLISKIVEAIRDSGRTSTKWSETVQELQSLCSDLTHLTTFQHTSPLDWVVADRLKAEGARCFSTTLNFHSKITGGTSQGIFQKVWWTTSEQKDLATFRTQLNERRVALWGMLALLDRCVLVRCTYMDTH